jgi:hypothetical protein
MRELFLIAKRSDAGLWRQAVVALTMTAGLTVSAFAGDTPYEPPFYHGTKPPISRPSAWKGLKLSVKVEPHFFEGDPIVVSATLTNISDKEMRVVWPKNGGANIIWRVRDLERKRVHCFVMDGDIRSELPRGREQSAERIPMGHLSPELLRCVPLKPGESLEGIDVLTDVRFQAGERPLLEFLAGKYEIVGAYTSDPVTAAMELRVHLPVIMAKVPGEPSYITVLTEPVEFVIEKLKSSDVVASENFTTSPYEYKCELYIAKGGLYFRRQFVGANKILLTPIFKANKEIPLPEKPMVVQLAKTSATGSKAVLVGEQDFTDAIWQEGNSLKAARISGKSVLTADVGAGQFVQAKRGEDGSLLVQLKKDGGAPQWQTVKFKSP